MKYSTPAIILCEFLGSLFLVLSAVSPIILFDQVLESGIAIAVLADSLAVGFVLFGLIEIFGPISGAHFNPAVSVALAITGRTKWVHVPSYIISQVLGGIVGVLFSHLMFYHQIPKILSISVKVRSGGNYVAEILGTFILLIAILLLIHYQSDKLALIIGLIVGGELITTSSTMFANPQVTLARTLTYSQAGIRPMDAAIFIIMQLVGMLLAVGTWKFLEKSQLPKS
ncbi:TPA: hypothetical protein EYN98_13995 [Candidatus Poribacteria bacterium]|nr:hypothetical protein [Candidatus Poribacteria bacterium]HIA67141.1 hypothetical protein [Candidatus Poribacteria bacterium]HIB87329.1 hypothetical protein [Candidatus Poribacteria bacterium]HIC01271.1 hypothetical protein [Candidatus Poribacteria bacterium]HIN30154.1 hypothetical protein [Candidatus Poribacteria bacterium]